MEDSFASLMMAAGMGSALGGADAPRVVEAPDGTRIMFFERSNSTREDREAGVVRTVFNGYFSIDGTMVASKDGQPLESGFTADFKDVGGPVAAGIWFAETVPEAVRQAFEAVFGVPFSDDGLRLDIGADAFLTFSDSNCWSAYASEEDDDEPLFEC